MDSTRREIDSASINPLQPLVMASISTGTVLSIQLSHLTELCKSTDLPEQVPRSDQYHSTEQNALLHQAPNSQ